MNQSLCRKKVDLAKEIRTFSKSLPWYNAHITRILSAEWQWLSLFHSSVMNMHYRACLQMWFIWISLQSCDIGRMGLSFSRWETKCENLVKVKWLGGRSGCFGWRVCWSNPLERPSMYSNFAQKDFESFSLEYFTNLQHIFEYPQWRQYFIFYVSGSQTRVSIRITWGAC